MITTNFVRFTHMTLLRQNSTTLDWTSLGHNFGLKFLQNGKKTRELRFGARRRPSLARLAHKIPTDPARTNRDLSACKEKESNRQYRFLSIDSLQKRVVHLWIWHDMRALARFKWGGDILQYKATVSVFNWCSQWQAGVQWDFGERLLSLGFSFWRSRLCPQDWESWKGRRRYLLGQRAHQQGD